MGDIIHTLPAITDASSIFPHILFDWVIEETFSEIPTWHPFIHKVIPIKLRFWKKKWYKLSTWKTYSEYIKQLNNNKYDIIIDAQGLLKTSVLFTNQITHGIKHGMDFISAKEPMSCWFYHKKHYINKNQHAIERVRQLFSYSLQYTLPTNLGKYNIAQNFNSKIQSHDINPYLIFFHATTQSNKHWPESHWYILINHAIKMGYRVKLPFWTSNEELRVRKLQRFCTQIIILPNFTLHQISNQIINSEAVISVDTGLSHLAAALNCPNLTLYGPTNPKLIGTYGYQNQIIIRSPTKKMVDIHPNYVWMIFTEKLLNLLT